MRDALAGRRRGYHHYSTGNQAQSQGAAAVDKREMARLDVSARTEKERAAAAAAAAARPQAPVVPKGVKSAERVGKRRR